MTANTEQGPPSDGEVVSYVNMSTDAWGQVVVTVRGHDGVHAEHVIPRSSFVLMVLDMMRHCWTSVTG